MKKLVCLLLLFTMLSSFACTSSLRIPHSNIYFYNHFLGSYTINLNPTLTAIENGSAGRGNPFYQKKWRGRCPSRLKGKIGSCIEYTVYPNNTNFAPSGIMQKIKQYTNDRPNRGEVRILTNASGTQYVYTTDHENTFCGPYELK